jgi:hypothetical protein
MVAANICQDTRKNNAMKININEQLEPGLCRTADGAVRRFKNSGVRPSRAQQPKSQLKKTQAINTTSLRLGGAINPQPLTTPSILSSQLLCLESRQRNQHDLCARAWVYQLGLVVFQMSDRFPPRAQNRIGSTSTTRHPSTTYAPNPGQMSPPHLFYLWDIMGHLTPQASPQRPLNVRFFQPQKPHKNSYFLIKTNKTVSYES